MSTPPLSSRSRALWWIAAALLLAAHAIVAWRSLTVNRLWEDEAYNLTVPLNAARGIGYASDGLLTGRGIEGSMPVPFDVPISTGPVVLLPAALLLRIAAFFGIEPAGETMVVIARLVPLAFWALLLTGLCLVGARIAGRWGALAAASLPLGLGLAHSESPIQGPADLLGEIPAAALLVWAFLALRKRPWLAGLFFGLAIQAKLISMLAGPALVVMCLMLARIEWRRIGQWWGALWRPAVFAIAPTALYQLWALLTLGFPAFKLQLKTTLVNLLEGARFAEASTPAQRLDALFGSWFVPVPIAALVTVLCGALACYAALRAGRQPPQPFEAAPPPPPAYDRDERTAVFIGATIGLLTFFAWWLTSLTSPVWVRQPSIALFAFAPMLAAFAVLGVQLLAHNRARGARILAAACAAAIVLASGAGALLQVRDTFGPRVLSLEEQNTAALDLKRAIDELGTTPPDWIATEWGGTVGVSVMTDYHVGRTHDPKLAEALWVLERAECTAGAPVVKAGLYLLCDPSGGVVVD